MLNTRIKTWQKVCIAICGIGFVFSVLLFIPFVQNLILDFGENVVVHRPLTRPVWIGQFVEWGGEILILCIIFAIAVFHPNLKNIFEKIILKFAKPQGVLKKPLFGIPLIYISLLGIGFVLMCLVYAIPTDNMKQNVKKSVPYFKISSEYGYQNTMESADSTLDDFTDALMLIEAAHKSDKAFPVAAMLNERPSHGLPYETLVAVYGDDIDGVHITAYPRFWHGYQIFLKPLLLFLSYGTIRYIMMSLHIILVIILIIIITEKKRVEQIIPFIAMWLSLNPAAVFLTMEYSIIFILTIIELIIINLYELEYSLSKILWIYHFFIVGCFTSYFNFLTFPLVTFGVPISFLLVMHGKSFYDNFVSFVKCGCSWVAGYIMMWAGKWAIGSIVCGINIFSDAKNAIIFRMSTSWGNRTFTYFDVLRKNLNTRSIIFFIFIIAIPFVAFKLMTGYRIHKKNYILIFTALLPFLWYFMTKNHSYIHSWMTFRILGITVYAIMLLAVSMDKKAEAD